MQLSGDISRSARNTLDNVNGIKYSFTISDKISGGGSSGVFSIVINVVSLNGAVASKTLTGVLQGSGGSVPTVSIPTSIRYYSSSNDTIVVANGGTPTTDTLVFVVRDSKEKPVKDAAVQFQFTKSLNASEYFLPSYAVSDDSGRVKVVVQSGVKAGVLHLVAKVDANGTTLSSIPRTILVKTGQLASLALISVSNTELSVRSVGGIENSSLVFEARDVLGNPLDMINQTKIYFQLQGGSGSGEQIKPDSGFTDPFTGRIQTTLTSGTRSTVLQVVAANAILLPTIKSSPVPVTVFGGFAVDSLFSFTGVQKNYSIYETTPVPLGVLAGDRFGNPVKTGTGIYFETNAGIVSASAFTDIVGRASALLQIVKDTRLLGMRYVKANTVGDNGTLVSKTANILLTGVPNIKLQNVTNDTIRVFDGGEVNVNFTVSDILNNPLSGGHMIDVTFGGDVASQLFVLGDANKELEDTQDPSNINFSILVRDKLTLAGTGGNFTVTIRVSGITGVKTKTFYGVLFAPNNIVVPPTARVPAQITFISSTATDLFVSGVGSSPENALLTYEVRDSLGIPIDKNKRVTASYTLNFFPNSFVGGGTPPSVIPKIDSTDDQGKLRVSVVSGTQSGNLQIVVKIDLGGGKIIQSEPVKITVHAGFPNQNHFTLIPARYSFLGFDIFNEIGFQVAVGDTFSNPVAENTAIYFHTQASLIQTGTNFSAYTDKSGRASVNLIGGVNPRPLVAPFAYLPSSGPYAAKINNRPGYHWVYAQTQGRGGKKVIDSVLVLQSKTPITAAGIPTNVTLSSGGTSLPIAITLKDGNGNPLPEGTTIAIGVKVVGNGLNIQFGVTGGLSSSAPTVVPRGADLIFPGPNITDYTIYVTDLSSGGAPVNTSCEVTISVSTPLTSTNYLTSATFSFTARVQ